MKSVKKTIVLMVVSAVVVATVGALDVPSLTGRVVDNAGMLSSSTEREIAALSQSVESSSGAQIAVLTVPGLEGEALEEFSIRVVEEWQLGSGERDNGVLLLVAAAEKKIRIEVGYGLEGVLTDAKSGLIIREILQPRFQRGDFDGGVLEAVRVIGSVAAGDEEALPSSASAERGGDPAFNAAGELLGKLILLFFIFGIGSFGRMRRRGGFGRALFWGFLLGNASRGHSHHTHRGGFGGGFSGGGFGGFSGGGGGFGGGGASGGW